MRAIIDRDSREGRVVVMKNVTWKPRALGILGLVVFTILGLAIPEACALTV